MLARTASCVHRTLQLERARREDQAQRRRHPLLLRWLPAIPRRERSVRHSTARMVDESNVAVQMGLHVASFLALKLLSRGLELEADKLGICLARDAGEGPCGQLQMSLLSCCERPLCNWQLRRSVLHFLQPRSSSLC